MVVAAIEAAAVVVVVVVARVMAGVGCVLRVGFRVSSCSGRSHCCYNYFRLEQCSKDAGCAIRLPSTDLAKELKTLQLWTWPSGGQFSKYQYSTAP